MQPSPSIPNDSRMHALQSSQIHFFSIETSNEVIHILAQRFLCCSFRCFLGGSPGSPWVGSFAFMGTIATMLSAAAISLGTGVWFV